MKLLQEAITYRREEDSPHTAAISRFNGHVAVDHAALQRQATPAQTDCTWHQTLLGRGIILMKQRLDRLLQPQIQTHYETGWDTYARTWESSVKQPGMVHVGDEWGTPQLTEAIVHQYVKPHLPAEAVILEIGSGEGKYSEQLAPLCKVLICADVSGKMIERAQRRLHRWTNIRFEKLSGLDLHPLASESTDFVFSFDCFVHIEIEDIYCYLQEVKRVLRRGGKGLLHFANLNSAAGWDKFITEAPTNRGQRKHFDRFCFLTWEIVDQFFRTLELEIVASQREPWRDILVVFQKGAD